MSEFDDLIDDENSINFDEQPVTDETTKSVDNHETVEEVVAEETLSEPVTEISTLDSEELVNEITDVEETEPVLDTTVTDEIETEQQTEEVEITADEEPSAIVNENAALTLDDVSHEVSQVVETASHAHIANIDSVVDLSESDLNQIQTNFDQWAMGMLANVDNPDTRFVYLAYNLLNT